MISEAELAVWQKLCDQATPAPWIAQGLERLGDPKVEDNDRDVIAAWSYAYPEGPISISASDAKFIAAARTALPRCLEEIRHQRAVLAASDKFAVGSIASLQKEIIESMRAEIKELQIEAGLLRATRQIIRQSEI